MGLCTEGDAHAEFAAVVECAATPGGGYAGCVRALVSVVTDPEAMAPDDCLDAVSFENPLDVVYATSGSPKDAVVGTMSGVCDHATATMYGYAVDEDAAV